MKAIKVCFISSKGGSGKTVTSSAIGTFLSELGFQVLLVDTDASTNGMTLLYLDRLLGNRRSSGPREMGLFDSKPRGAPSIVKISDKLHFIPATFSMNDTEKTSIDTFSENLRRTISKNNELYDFIIFDAQAGADSFSRIVTEKSDHSVIVSEYDPVSVQGIDRLKILLSDAIDPGSNWTLFNKILPEFASVVGEGLSVARYLSPIPWDADVVRAFSRRDLAINMTYPNTYTVAISQAINMMLSDLVGERIEQWLAQTSFEVTSPLKHRMKEIETKIQEISNESKKREGILRASVVALTSISFIIIQLCASKFIPDNEYISNIYPAAISIIAAIIIGITSFFLAKIQYSSKSNITTKDALSKELSKLKITVDAAESTLRYSQNAGYYERKRRDGFI